MTRAPHPLAPQWRAVTVADLAGLLASLVLAAGPHAARLPWWLAAFTLALYAWRGLAALGVGRLPSRALLLVLTAAAFAGVWLEYRMIFGRLPGVALLVLFSGLKLLECRTHRDATVLAFLCYFLIMTNLLYEQGIPTALLMAVALVAVTATLIGFNAPQRGLLPNLRTAVLLFAHAGPIALALFLLFPRVPGPLWSLPRDAYAGTTGLSDTMTPGAFEQLVESDSIAFRAKFDGRPPAPRDRYWRGPVLWDFDGRTWSMGTTFVDPAFRPPDRGTAVYRYSVLLEPQPRNWLFALESAASLPPRAVFTRDGQIISRVPLRTRLRYDMVSIVGATPDRQLTRRELQRALRLPAEGNPRARALAAEWRSESSSDEQVLERAVRYLRGAHLVYTLEPQPLTSDSVDGFLFRTHEGFCEHFASAFVYLMRAAGVPARVVTGYQGGDLNPVDHILTVRQSDAHAWGEVYLAGQGWVRVDPTALAVPGRLTSGLARSIPGDALVPIMLRPRFDWLRALRDNWEAVAYKWNIWVLGYDASRQRDLMAMIGVSNADWRSLTAALSVILGSLAALLVAWSLRRSLRPDPVQSAWLAFCRKLAAKGLARAGHEGPRDFAERAARGQPAAEVAIRRIGELYIALRYGRGAGTADVRELRRLVRALRPT